MGPRRGLPRRSSPHLPGCRKVHGAFWPRGTARAPPGAVAGIREGQAMIHETPHCPPTERMSLRLWLTAALFLASGAGLAAWSLVSTSRELRRFEGHDGPVLSVAFAPDGRSIFSAGWDGIVRQW